MANKRVAWWADGVPNRTWLRMNGFTDTLRLSDRVVQGERPEDLIVELTEELHERAKEYVRLEKDGESYFYSRDRYGWYSPYHPARHAHSDISRRIEDQISALMEGTFGPPYSIGVLESGEYDYCSVEKFEPK